MEIKIEKIKSFQDLEAWQEGHKLVIQVFQVTNTYPKEEVYGLIGHSKRASLSITTNISEAFSRTNFKEKIQYYSFALKGVREVQNFLLVARDLGYLKSDSFDKIAAQTAIVSRICGDLVKGGKR